MKVSVIVPSRLQVDPESRPRSLYLDRSLSSIHGQTIADPDLEVIIGLDCGARPPARFTSEGSTRVTYSTGEGQSAALNAACRCATGDVIGFLEDDDRWNPGKLAVQLELLKTYDFVSCTQREHDRFGNIVRFNDFPTMSGWLMRREVWEKVGPFDETFRWHMDTEWLGRLNRSGAKRVHVLPDEGARPWVKNVASWSALVRANDIAGALVERLVNERGGMWKIAHDRKAAAQSAGEHARMLAAFGTYPW